MTWYQLSAQPVRLLAQAVRDMLQAKLAFSPRITCVSSYQKSSELAMNPRDGAMNASEQTLSQRAGAAK